MAAGWGGRNPQPARRPDVDQLMQVPQIKLHLRERKVQQQYVPPGRSAAAKTVVRARKPTP